VGFDGGGGALTGSGGSEAGLRCEEGEGVRMNRTTEEETGVRVRLTEGRGGGGVSCQIPWRGGGCRVVEATGRKAGEREWWPSLFLKAARWSGAKRKRETGALRARPCGEGRGGGGWCGGR
jgi:hypothetical protein